MNKEFYYQTETINYPAATSARTMTKEVILNSSYERCVGIAVFESRGGGLPMYRIGLDDKDQQYISAVHKDLLASDKAAGMETSKRFLPLNIKAGGHKVKVNTELPWDTTDVLEYDIVFLLERGMQKV
jgi:hypothetical protein